MYRGIEWGILNISDGDVRNRSWRIERDRRWKRSSTGDFDFGYRRQLGDGKEALSVITLDFVNLSRATESNFTGSHDGWDRGGLELVRLPRHENGVAALRHCKRRGVTRKDKNAFGGRWIVIWLRCLYEEPSAKKSSNDATDRHFSVEGEGGPVIGSLDYGDGGISTSCLGPRRASQKSGKRQASYLYQTPHF